MKSSVERKLKRVSDSFQIWERFFRFRLAPFFQCADIHKSFKGFQKKPHYSFRYSFTGFIKIHLHTQFVLVAFHNIFRGPPIDKLLTVSLPNLRCFFSKYDNWRDTRRLNILCFDVFSPSRFLLLPLSIFISFFVFSLSLFFIFPLFSLPLLLFLSLLYSCCYQCVYLCPFFFFSFLIASLHLPFSFFFSFCFFLPFS